MQLDLFNQNEGLFSMDCDCPRILDLNCHIVNSIINTHAANAKCGFDELMDFLKRCEGPDKNNDLQYA